MNDDDLWISAALDDELDGPSSLAFARRLANEPALKARWDGQRALRDAVRARATRHAASEDLLAGVRARLGLQADAPVAPVARPDPRDAPAHPLARGGAASQGGERRPPDRARHPGGYALGGAVVASALTWWIVQPPLPAAAGPGTGDAGARDAGDASEAVSAHTRALLVDHPIEVASSDQHTVRPWLSARLNFVPPVADLASQGYALLGARRDVLAGETAAALVYRHGAHVISVFVRPAPPGQRDGADAPRVVRGFNVIRRTHGGMAFCLVSDLNPQELAGLADLLMAAK